MDKTSTYHAACALIRATLKDAMGDDGGDDGINEAKRLESWKCLQYTDDWLKLNFIELFIKKIIEYVR